MGSLRVLLRVKVLTSTGVRLRVADLIASKAAAASETRQNVKRLLASGHLERVGGPAAGYLSCKPYRAASSRRNAARPRTGAAGVCQLQTMRAI